METGKADRHKAALEYAVRYLLHQYRNEVYAIYAYGSFARGEHRYHSDVDLLVYLEAPLDAATMRKMKAGVISDDYTLPDVELNLQVKGTEMTCRQFHENVERDRRLIWKKK